MFLYLKVIKEKYHNLEIQCFSKIITNYFSKNCKKSLIKRKPRDHITEPILPFALMPTNLPTTLHLAQEESHFGLAT